MRRLFWVGVGAAATVAALRKAREVTDRHVPAGARTALGAAAGVSTLARRAAAEFRAGTAEREAELRADLLAGADLPRSRARVDAWRAERDRSRDVGAPDTVVRPQDDPTDAAGILAGDPETARRLAGRHGRPGSAAAAHRAAAHRPGPHRPGAQGAEDPDDGPLGYSFY